MSGKPKHGMSHSRIYQIWSDMKQRCLNSKHKWYQSYGGRGITICDEWIDFLPFYNWAIENGYSDDLTIDRINNDGNYCPNNCRWATHKQQVHNSGVMDCRSNTGFVGISQYSEKNRKKRYAAELKRDGIRYRLGRFYTPEEAYKAREEFIRRNNL